MKRCEYCAKEIDYSKMYCCKACEDNANDYYRKRLKSRIPMNITYIAGTIIMALGIFFSPIFTFWALLAIAASGIAMGVATILLPCPTGEMIKKHKMIKAQSRLKIFGAILVAFGTAALAMAIVQLFI